MRECVFYDDEGCAPKKGAEDQGEVGFDGGGLGSGGGRVDDGSTREACLRMGVRLASDMGGCNEETEKTKLE